MYGMEISCISCSYDLEDKLGLTKLESISQRPVALCQIDTRDALLYPLPKSTAVQAQICRFVQEAIHAQFHLIRQANKTLEWPLIEKVLAETARQFEFFLKNHKWQAQVHILILLPNLLPDQPQAPGKEPLGELITVGQPYVIGLNTLEGGPLLILDNMGSDNIPLGNNYPMSIQRHRISQKQFPRLLIASTSWQQLRPGRLSELLNTPWMDVPQLLTEMINGSELENSPFYLVHLERSRRRLFPGLHRRYQMLRQSFLKLLYIQT